MDGKPILFSAPMVRALLDGSKTQTRRVVKIPTCPYGQAGGTLWVREAWRASSAHNNLPPREIPEGDAIHYQADGFARILTGKCRPSMFMPRWASRITLEITAVRVERLNQISLSDVRAEGCEVRAFWTFGADDAERQRIGANVYRALWESINGPGSWDLNPFVWVIEFAKVRGTT